LYQKYHLNPRMERDPNLKPEARLEIALIAAPFIPASLLIFGWSARESVHWCVVPRTCSAGSSERAS